MSQRPVKSSCWTEICTSETFAVPLASTSFSGSASRGWGPLHLPRSVNLNSNNPRLGGERVLQGLPIHQPQPSRVSVPVLKPGHEWGTRLALHALAFPVLAFSTPRTQIKSPLVDVSMRLSCLPNTAETEIMRRVAARLWHSSFSSFSPHPFCRRRTLVS